jgi:hypothetical protein
MKTHKTFLAACLAVLLGAGAAGASLAQEATPRVELRQERQAERIAQGVRSGELTVAERRQLRTQQRTIERVQDQAAADGVVTRAERRRLHALQDRASASIHRQKNDRQRVLRPSAGLR